MTVEKVLTSAVGVRKIKDQFWGTDDSGSFHFPTDFHARLAEAEDTSFWFGHRNEIIGLMVSRFPPAGPIVDIGGGNGFVARGLKQRGIASIVPASPSLWSSDDEFAKHCRRYTHRSLAELLHKAGFEPVILTYFFSLLVVPVYLLRTIASQLGLRRVTTADDAIAHHAGKSGMSDLASACLSFEVSALKAGMRLPFGTSLVAVARKSLA